MCKYCENEAEILKREIQPFFNEEIESEIWINAGDKEIYCMLGAINVATATGIKYCPMCGKKLNG